MSGNQEPVGDMILVYLCKKMQNFTFGKLCEFSPVSHTSVVVISPFQRWQNWRTRDSLLGNGTEILREKYETVLMYFFFICLEQYVFWYSVKNLQAISLMSQV